MLHRAMITNRGPLYYLCQQEELRKKEEFRQRILSARLELEKEESEKALAALEEAQKSSPRKGLATSYLPAHIHFDLCDLPTIAIVRDAVCDHFKVTFRSLFVSDRRLPTVYKRSIAFWCAYRYTDRSLTMCGNFFGGKDHTTVLNSLNKVKQAFVDNNEQTRTDVNSILLLMVEQGLRYPEYWGA